jgi:hypothetical protein
VMEQLRVAGAVTARGNERVRFGIGHAAAHEFKQGRAAHARILQSRERRARENRLAVRSMARHFENHGVRESGEMHSFKLARVLPEIVEAGEGENHLVAHPGLAHADDVVRPERLSALVIYLHRLNAGGIRKSGVMKFQDFGHFGGCDAQRSKLLNTVVIHPGAIQLLRVGDGGRVMAPPEKRCENKYDNAAKLSNAALA